MKRTFALSVRELIVLAAASLVLGHLLRSVLDGPESLWGNALWVVFLPAWLLTIPLFGGIHGSHSWGVLPSFVLAVFIELTALWLGLRWLGRKVRGRSHAA